MASTFPGAIDSFTDPLSGSALNSPSHSAQHADLNDAAEKIETYMGLIKVNPTSVAGTGVTVSATGTVSYSATTAVSVNGCFSALYSNYRILIASTNGSVDGQILLRMRLAGTDASGATDYDYSASQYNYGTLLNLGSSSGGSSAVIGYKVASFPSSMSLDFYNPFIARNTLFSGAGQYTGLILGAGGQHKQAVSYDGFTLTSGAGTMTGIVTVYGYRI